jgi:PST family polysaccharide transporter
LTAIIIPFIAVQRVFNGVINGLSEYKKYAKIDLISYLFSALLTVFFLFQYNLDGVLVAIAITPVVQVSVMLFFFYKVLREYIQFKDLTLQAPMAKALLAFTVMSFVSSILLPIVEIDIRGMLDEKLSGRDAGIWTNMTFISQNYMVFSSSIFTLYVIPKFAGIYNAGNFKKEVFSIYKTLLPLFAGGMILVFFFRNVIIDIIYPGQIEMAPLFKWQLMGDFVRLASLVLAHQFLAKKLVINFIFTEIMSLALFYGFAYYFTGIYGVEGVVMAHFLRYLVYFFVVLYLVSRYFKKKRSAIE